MSKTGKKTDGGPTTPLMKQYFSIKSKYPDAILLFRVGDFYETFGEDAKTAARILGITLTSRNNGGDDTALAGFPHHSVEVYIPRLVKAGFRVAICDQLEKPSPNKKVVKRGVTEVITPGVVTGDSLLNQKRNNYLAAVQPGRDNTIGLAMLDITTGEFLVSEGDIAGADKLLQSFNPSEVIFMRSFKDRFEQFFGNRFYQYLLDDWVFHLDFAQEKLLGHFSVSNLKGFGIDNMPAAQIAAGAILYYVATTEKTDLSHINRIARMQSDAYVWLDRFTIRNLELVRSQHEGGVSLIEIIDRTVSAMGGRMLHKWLLLPLRNLDEINARQEAVTYFFNHRETAAAFTQWVSGIGDLERLIAKVPLGKINPREVNQIRVALDIIKKVKTGLLETKHPQLAEIAGKLNLCIALRNRIAESLNDDPPVKLDKGGVIRNGASTELDEWRHLIKNSKTMLVDLQQKEARATGIDNLKVGFNNVFGYYLEVTNKYKNKGLVPDNWVRKQTLTNAERYVTDELKQLETKILSAEDRISILEEELFSELVAELGQYIEPVQHNADLIARLDCMLSLAAVAAENEYVRPELNNGLTIKITDGRHPVIEKQLPPEEAYIPNSVVLDHEDCQICMITGPNMSGKSAVLRQTALICLLAQMGGYVPAASAELGLVDKIFTRVGASDNISSGESTFMVEMSETASIMNNISDRSLILLDEIGRGTSTYDGISIAWSIAEFLHENGLARPKTLFATHYHELNELARRFSRIKNFNISVKQIDGKVLFLRKLVPGGSNHSFGIYVARMAGMPGVVVERSEQILRELEDQRGEHIGEGSNGHPATDRELAKKVAALSHSPVQLSIFETSDPHIARIRELLQEIDLHTLTPIDCMMKLKELQQLAAASMKKS